MLIFIDESGIHKKVDHSSFVLVYLALEDYSSVSMGIEKIERELKIGKFHWADFGSKRGWEVRKKFIEAAANLLFTFKYSIVPNPIVPAESFYDAVSYLITERNIEKIVIDGSQPKWYERQVKRSLRNRNLSIGKLKISRDGSEPVLRLADALAGLIRSYHDNPTGVAKDLYLLLKVKHKIAAHLTVGG